MPRWLGGFLARTETVLAAVIVVAAVVFSLTTPYFFTLSNAVDLIEAYSVTTILAAGVFVVLVSGGIDISFAATASVAQYVAAWAAARHGLPAIPTIALACAVGMSLGAINGLLTHHLRVVSIIVTIATASIYYALLIYFTGGSEIYNLPDWWTNRFILFRHEAANGDIVRITFPIVIMIAVVLVTQFMMARMRIGRQILTVLDPLARVGEHS